MAISINEVKAIYQAACENELPEFINRFGSDERASVQKLVISAEKKLVEALKAMLGIAAKVKLVAPKSITRSEGKAVRVIDKRKI